MLLQVIDVSSKMLFDKIDAKQQFLSLINATISHELRNPLNSLVGQTDILMVFMNDLKQLITYVSDPDMKKLLLEIMGGVQSCSKKIMSATKFTDFFVHDILDYTIITKEGKNFVKNITVFDIQDTINELKDILEDKVKMKKITCKVNLVNMNNKSDRIVKTDQKRLQ